MADTYYARRRSTELKEFVALIPQIMSVTPPTSRAMDTTLFITVFR